MSSVNEAWEYDGVDLTTYGYDVKALGANEQVPAYRGENIIVPGKTGRVHTAKVMDERYLSLGMIVRGSETGNKTAMSGSALWTNLDTLKKCFAKGGARTLKHQSNGTTRLATAEVANVVEFTPGGPYHYDFVVEFVMADPFWYAEAASTVGPTTITAGTQNITVSNNGTYENQGAVITFTGPGVNPKFTVDSCYVQYTGSVSAGSTLSIDVSAYTATIGAATVTEDITHDGDTAWLPFPTGDNTLTVECASYGTTTTVQVVYTEAYI
jgi:hypothetical protein